jgi:enamine deaminase RidA (YjgF/YER057c/UK114 family)
MPKQIIRRFHGLSGPKDGKGIYAQAIRSRGDLIFLMGQGGYDLDGNFVGSGDAGAQAAQACRNIRQLLAESAAGLDALCKLTVYMTDLAFRRPVYLAIEREFRGGTFCRTGMVVDSLGPPEYLVEIDAFAILAPN